LGLVVEFASGSLYNIKACKIHMFESISLDNSFAPYRAKSKHIWGLMKLFKQKIKKVA
jgi:hypothetical protein